MCVRTKRKSPHTFSLTPMKPSNVWHGPSSTSCACHRYSSNRIETRNSCCGYSHYRPDTGNKPYSDQTAQIISARFLLCQTLGPISLRVYAKSTAARAKWSAGPSQKAWRQKSCTMVRKRLLPGKRPREKHLSRADRDLSPVPEQQLHAAGVHVEFAGSFIVLHTRVLSALRHSYRGLSCFLMIRSRTFFDGSKGFILLSEENKKSEPFSYRKKVRILLMWCTSMDSNHGPTD